LSVYDCRIHYFVKPLICIQTTYPIILIFIHEFIIWSELVVFVVIGLPRTNARRVQNCSATVFKGLLYNIACSQAPAVRCTEATAFGAAMTRDASSKGNGVDLRDSEGRSNETRYKRDRT